MKRYFTIFTILLASNFCQKAIGQLSIRAGINVSELDFDNDIFDSESRTGIQAGITYGVNLGDRIKLRPGAILSIKGFKSLNETGNLTYLEFPLSLLFYIIGSADGIFLEIGPYAGAMLGNNKTFDVDYNNLDLGLNIGAGIKLGRIGAGITYGYGLANIIDGDLSMNETQARNKNIGIYANVYF
jgi:hypothetical protein